MDAECALKNIFTHAECVLKKYKETTEVSFLQQSACAAPGCVCSTADCATWKCLFYSRMFNVYGWVCSTVQQHVLPLDFEVPVHAFAAPGGVWPIAACATPGPVCLQESVLHLYMDVYYKSLGLHLYMSVYKSFVLHLEESVYESLHLEVSVYQSLCCTSSECVLLCCSWTCLQ